MSEHDVVIRSDLENIIGISSDQFENNLQQELDELILAGSESESDFEDEANLTSDTEEEDDEDITIPMNDDIVEYSDRNCVSVETNSAGKRTLYLTEEELGIIYNCTDPKLKHLLLMNRAKAAHLKTLCKKLWQLYDELGANIRKHKEKFRQEEPRKVNSDLTMSKTFIWKLAVPFFKDKSFYSAPPNKDLAGKKQNKELILTKLAEGRKWTIEDQHILKDAVIASYYNHQRTQLEQDIGLFKAHVKVSLDEKDILENTEKLEHLESKLQILNRAKNEPPPINCTEGIDWFKIAGFDLKGRHTYLECKAFWNIYLHPSINKTDWLPEENEQIKELAIACNHDWDLVAEELMTNRSPYLVCVHYNTKLCDKFRRQRFLPEEDEFLMEVVDNCRLADYIPWGRVAYYFEDRSKHQLYHRYKYYLSCKNIKKGTFTEAEDILLTYLADKFGRDFSRISELMPQRTSIQLRNRYSSYLQKADILLGNFTQSDDQKILQHVQAYGHKNWSILARKLNRTRAHVRQRYLTLMRCMERQPGLTVASLPRRQQSFLQRLQTKRNERMATCLAKIKALQGIPTLATVETFVKQIDRDLSKKNKKWRVLKAPVRRTQSDVDKKIIDFFQGTCKMQRQYKVTNERCLTDAARRVIKLFDALGADPNLLKDPEILNNSLLSDMDEEILKNIRIILETNKGAQNSFITEPIPIPGPSHVDPLFLDLPNRPVKHLLPPNVNTSIGLRCMIIKYQIYKAANRNLTAIIKMESNKPAPDDPMLWKIQQNLLQLDVATKTRIEREREIFYKRLCAILKWPCIISKYFPQHLLKEEDNQEEEDVIEEQQEKRKIGRPPKKVYTKVLKMVEAKKRKRKENNKSDDSISSCETTTTNTHTTTTNKSDKIKSKKTKRGRPPNQPKSEHAVAYIPRRSHVKVNDETNIDCPSKRTRSTQRKTKPPAPLPTQKVINVLDLKLVNSNIAGVSKDQLDKLIKLNKIHNPKQIIVLQGTSEKFVGNPPPAKVQNQQLTITEPQEEVLEVITIDPTPDEVNNEYVYITESHDQAQPDQSEPSEMISISKEEWNQYCKKWKNLKLSNTEKTILEEDLNKIEKSSTSTTSSELEPNISERDDQIMDTTFAVKMEAEFLLGAEEEIDNITDGFSEELVHLKEEEEEEMSDEDNCTKKMSDIENNKIKLIATMEKLKKSYKS